VRRGLIASTLIASSLAGCTTGNASPQPAPNLSASQPDTATDASCTKREIADAVARFVAAWNAGDAAGLQDSFTGNANLSMSNAAQGARAPGTGISTDSAGWDQIQTFAERQHEAGQRLSYERVQVVARRGAYGVGMRATYAHGTSQSFVDSKFSYSCDEHAIERVVLIAKAPAR
jgi:hypothetical protein